MHGACAQTARHPGRVSRREVPAGCSGVSTQKRGITTAISCRNDSLHNCLCHMIGCNFHNMTFLQIMDGTILIVEDETEIQHLIAVNLQHAGYRAMRAASVLEAE